MPCTAGMRYRFSPLPARRGTSLAEILSHVGRTKRSAVPALVRNLPEQRSAWSGLRNSATAPATPARDRLRFGWRLFLLTSDSERAKCKVQIVVLCSAGTLQPGQTSDEPGRAGRLKSSNVRPGSLSFIFSTTGRFGTCLWRNPKSSKMTSNN